jgi:hypothetical protein
MLATIRTVEHWTAFDRLVGVLLAVAIVWLIAYAMVRVTHRR